MLEARTQRNSQLLNPGRNLSTTWKSKSSNGVGGEGRVPLFYMLDMRYLGNTQTKGSRKCLRVQDEKQNKAAFQSISRQMENAL